MASLDCENWGRGVLITRYVPCFRRPHSGAACMGFSLCLLLRLCMRSCTPRPCHVASVPITADQLLVPYGSISRSSQMTQTSVHMLGSLPEQRRSCGDGFAEERYREEPRLCRFTMDALCFNMNLRLRNQSPQDLELIRIQRRDTHFDSAPMEQAHELHTRTPLIKCGNRTSMPSPVDTDMHKTVLANHAAH